jgi:hypothetical protein
MSNFDALAFMFTLTVLYVLECGAWIRRDALLLVKATKGYALRRSGGLFSTDRGWLAILDPLPPLSPAFVVQALPLSLAPEGASTHVIPALHPHGRQAVERRLLAFSDLEKIEVDGKTVLASGVSIPTGNARMAMEVARILTALKTKDSGARQAVLDGIFDQALDVVEAQTRVAMVFLQVFLLLPALYFTGFLYPKALIFVGELGLLLLANAHAYFVAHKKLYPRLRVERFSTSLSMTIWPPAAIRSHDKLARHLFVGLHPLAVTQALAPAEEVRDFLASLLRDAAHPLGLEGGSDDNDERLASIESSFAHLHRARLLAVAHDLDLTEKAVLAPPKKEGDLLKSHCPRCLLQYRVERGDCADCGGVPLVPFKEGQEKGAKK